MFYNFPVVAIGASSGSLEEINSFFDYTIALDVAYVIIHNFSIVNTARLVELLSRHSKLSVQEVKHQTKAEKNVVYFLPIGQRVSVKDYKFQFAPNNTDQPQLIADVFFKSLAACCGDKAIAIILSGKGIDVSGGLTEIKQAGGKVIVRNPRTTAFYELPASAIASGMADHVIEPELMPALLAEILSGSSSQNIDTELK